MLDLGELLLVKTPMEVILRVTVVMKKMMVVMKHWVLLQQFPANTTTKNVPIIAKIMKIQVLPTAWCEFLKQPRENTPSQENPVVPGAALQVHGDRRNKEENRWCSGKWAVWHTFVHWRYHYQQLCKGHLCNDSTYVYAPKHDMKKFRPNFERLIESKIATKRPFEMKAKVSSKEIEP